MHTKVVHRTARLLADRLRLLSVRFNFRGVGASAGRHDDGRGEVDDLLAAVHFARDRHPAGRFVLAGFSFGSVCAIRAAARAMPAVLLLIGVPLSRWELPDLESLPDLPVVIVQGENDEFGSPEALAPLAERHDWDLRVVPSADHFFTDRLDRFEEMALAGLNAALAKTA
jgi:alpha/beta superfamily hydrolase